MTKNKVRVLMKRNDKTGTISKLNVEQKENHMHQLAEYRTKLRENPQLRSLFIELTPFCNEHCRHCGSRCGDIKVDNMLTTDEIKGFLQQLSKQIQPKDLRLCVTGGEPLLREDFFDIMQYADSLGYRWGMTSNGTLITKEVAQKLKETHMKTISVSVDGLEETHDWFRQKSGSYKETIEGIQNLLDVKAFQSVQITTVVYHQNISQLEKMYHIFSKMGVNSWRVINIEPIGRAKDQPELLLNKAEYHRMFEFIQKKRKKGKMEVTYGCSHYLGTELEREVRKWYFLCNAGIYTASIMYNGDIGACLDIERRPELIQGNIRTDDFLEVWKNRFQTFRTDSRKCQNCPEYEFCAGDSFHTWDFEKNEPALCMNQMLNT